MNSNEMSGHELIQQQRPRRPNYIFLNVFIYKVLRYANPFMSDEFIIKTLPILCLALFVHLDGWNNAMAKVHGRGYLLIAALLAAACGDFVISIRDTIEPSFALSALFFAVSHSFYMVFLVAHLRRLSVPLTLCCAAYAVLMSMCFLMPNLGTHPFSTVVLVAYSLVLTAALVVSGSLMSRGTQFHPPYQKHNVMHFVGYCLFCVSDSLLLLEHADVKLPYHKERLILSTYYLAQYLIVRGALETESI